MKGTGVLAMLELDGDPAELIAALEHIDRHVKPAGLQARVVARTDAGVVLFQLWESPEARAGNADDPEHAAALEASGISGTARATRSRVFEHATLEILDG